jgi:uncharacterized protein
MIAIRDAALTDFPKILALNEAWVHYLSPLSEDRLRVLHQDSSYHRVVEVDGSVEAFLLGFSQGRAYDSVNYLWFAQRFERFLYVDRIVVSDKAQGQGLGAMLYKDFFAFARLIHASRITAEFDIDPPNPGSKIFHERFGFREIGTQAVAGGSKWVSLQCAEISQ